MMELTDVELVARFQDGRDDALQVILTRYRRFARVKARSYFLVGADSEDVEQEALIGLYKAARDFRPEHESSFRAFAELCITRQIITAIKTATRQKHQALNQYVSISGSRAGDEPGERQVEDLIQLHRHGSDPADRIIAAERYHAMRQRLSEVLSGLEVEVLHLYVEGRSYQEIGVLLDRHVKSIDNALQRIRRKLELHLAERTVADRQDDLALIA
ncbi:MAG: RNA polymerase sporulation sigma factor SigH [Acidimicrobiales bacterium]|nr:RNA polymerase sporulation sigma factor SigH [Acidimicrobiales bacterium]